MKIGILGKGGSGKSTFTVLLARALARRGYSVCVVDADSTNIGLSDALGIAGEPAELIDHFGGMVFSGGRVTCPVDDPTPLAGARARITELPLEFRRQSPEGVTLLTIGKMGHRGPGGGCDGPMGKIARDLRLEADSDRLVTLVDFKAGFEDSARGVITGLDLAVVVVDPTRAAFEMAADMKNMLEEIHTGGLPATRHLGSPDLVELARRAFRRADIKAVLVVVNRVKSEETERYVNTALSERGIAAVGTIPYDPRIPMAWLRGEPLDDSGTRKELVGIIEGLEREADKAAPAQATGD
jgi:CO dehydrogenase nickel-insertion accessory protein CooC1